MNLTIPMWGYFLEWFSPFVIAMIISRQFLRLGWWLSITFSLAIDGVWCMFVAYPVGVGVFALSLVALAITLYRSAFRVH